MTIPNVRRAPARAAGGVPYALAYLLHPASTLRPRGGAPAPGANVLEGSPGHVQAVSFVAIDVADDASTPKVSARHDDIAKRSTNGGKGDESPQPPVGFHFALGFWRKLRLADGATHGAVQERRQCRSEAIQALVPRSRGEVGPPEATVVDLVLQKVLDDDASCGLLSTSVHLGEVHAGNSLAEAAHLHDVKKHSLARLHLWVQWVLSAGHAGASAPPPVPGAPSPSCGTPLRDGPRRWRHGCTRSSTASRIRHP